MYVLCMSTLADGAGERARYDSLQDETDALRARVTLVEPGIVLWCEPPHSTVARLTTMFERYCELCDPTTPSATIADVRDSRRGSPGVRAKAAEFARVVTGRVHVSTLVGNNLLLYVGMRMMGVRAPLSSQSYHRDYESALAVARSKLMAAASTRQR